MDEGRCQRSIVTTPAVSPALYSICSDTKPEGQKVALSKETFVLVLTLKLNLQN